MSKLDSFPDRALDLATQAGATLRHFMPDATTLIGTGAKLGALRAGARVGMMVVRRNPVIAIATIAGAGVLWYAAKRRAERVENGNGEGATIEGSSRRIEARKATKTDKAEKTPAARRRASTTTRRASASRSRGTESEPRTEH